MVKVSICVGSACHMKGAYLTTQMFQEALQKAGLPADDGPFSPHITLARHARTAGQWPECPPACFTAEQAHVYLSARDHENVLRYTPLDTVSFRK